MLPPSNNVQPIHCQVRMRYTLLKHYNATYQDILYGQFVYLYGRSIE